MFTLLAAALDPLGCFFFSRFWAQNGHQNWSWGKQAIQPDSAGFTGVMIDVNRPKRTLTKVTKK